MTEKTASQESDNKKKLKRSTYADRARTGNEIGEIAVCERVDGGFGRLVVFYLRYTGIAKNLLVGNGLVFIGDGTMMKSYELDDGTFLEFNDEEGVATFTSDGIQYRIRPLQDSDSSWVVGLDEFLQAQTEEG